MKNKKLAEKAVESMKKEKMIAVANYWIDNQNRVKSIEQISSSLNITKQSALNLTGFLSNNYGFVFKKNGTGKRSEYKLIDCKFGNESMTMPEIGYFLRLALGLNVSCCEQLK